MIYLIGLVIILCLLLWWASAPPRRPDDLRLPKLPKAKLKHPSRTMQDLSSWERYHRH